MSVIPNTVAGFSGDMTGAGAIFAGATPETDTGLVVERLNSLLRGEISAAETYKSALAKASAEHPKVVAELPGIQAEHTNACQAIRERIVELGGQPAESSGLWGVWANTVQSALSLVGGEAGSLRALREGEDHGLKDYESALNEVDAETAQLIQNRLIPLQQRHLETLDRLIKSRA